MGTRNRVGFSTVAIILLMASPVPAAANTPHAADTFDGIPFRITDSAAGSGAQVPVAAYNSRNDQYLVVWSDQRESDTRQTDIYGQLVKGDGTLIGTNVRISGDDATGPEYPTAVAYNSVSNQYLVVWQDERDGGYDIYGRRVKASGAMAGGEFLISGDIAGDPAVAHNPVTNQYLVVWSAGDIYGQRVKATGSLAGDEFRISGDAATGREYSPAVVCNPTNGQFFVVWEDDRLGLTDADRDVFGRRIKGAGRPAGDDFVISEAAVVAGGERPAVAYNSTNNEYVVVWQDNRNHMTTQHDIYGRRVKVGGRLTGGDIRISGNPEADYEHKPSVAYDSATNRYLVAWEDYRDFDARRDEIYIRRMKAGGKPVGSDSRIVGNPAVADDNDPFIANGSAHDQFLVVWVDFRAGNGGIYGRIVNG